MAEDVIVVGAAPCIDEEKRLAVRHPMLLGVVILQLAAIIEAPGLRFVEMQPIRAGGDVSAHIVAQREEVTILENV